MIDKKLLPLMIGEAFYKVEIERLNHSYTCPLCTGRGFVHEEANGNVVTRDCNVCDGSKKIWVGETKKEIKAIEIDTIRLERQGSKNRVFISLNEDEYENPVLLQFTKAGWAFVSDEVYFFTAEEARAFAESQK